MSSQSKVFRPLVSVSFAALLGAAGSTPAFAGSDGLRQTHCPTTTANDARSGTYGNEALVVYLHPEGKIVFEPGGPGFIDRDGALGIKVPWERRKQGLLQITGHRRDGEAARARAYIHDYGDIGFQPSYVVFPTPGCWEITGRVENESLTFVVLVEKIGEGPSGRFRGPQPGSRVTQ